MERIEVLDMMGELKLYGMKAAYDETLAVALKRQHEPQRFVGDLLKAEISEKQARSIKYQLAIAKLPLASRNSLNSAGISTTSRSRTRRSTRRLSAPSPAAALSPSSATACS
jgi:hypothetical protein